MAIDSAKKRKSVAALANPMLPVTVDVNAAIDNFDRAAVAWNYGGFTFDVGIIWASFGSAFKADGTELAGGRYREMFAGDDLVI